MGTYVRPLCGRGCGSRNVFEGPSPAALCPAPASHCPVLFGCVAIAQCEGSSRQRGPPQPPPSPRCLQHFSNRMFGGVIRENSSVGHERPVALRWPVACSSSQTACPGSLRAGGRLGIAIAIRQRKPMNQIHDRTGATGNSPFPSKSNDRESALESTCGNGWFNHC